MFEGFDYLRLNNVLAKQIQHPELYIKGPNKEQRRIFKAVQYDQQEKRALKEFKDKLDQDGVQYNSDYQTDDVLMRFLHANDMKIDPAEKQLDQHLQWLQQSSNYDLDKVIHALLQSGGFYLAGRDKQFRPTLVINADAFDIEKNGTQIYVKAICILCMVMEDYYFFDGKVENWNIIIDMKERTLLNTKQEEYLKMLQTFYVNFPCTVEKIYILNPSLSVQLVWNQIIEKLPNRRKIQIIEPQQLFIALGNQLEKKYGLGKLENIKKFWPPYNTLSESKQYQEQKLIKDEKNSIVLEPAKDQVVAKNNDSKLSVTEMPKKSTIFASKAMGKITYSKTDIKQFTPFQEDEEHDFKGYTKFMVPERSTEPIRNISKYNRFTTTQKLQELQSVVEEQEQSQQGTVKQSQHSSVHIMSPDQQRTVKTVKKGKKTTQEPDDELSACQMF